MKHGRTYSCELCIPEMYTSCIHLVIQEHSALRGVAQRGSFGLGLLYVDLSAHRWHPHCAMTGRTSCRRTFTRAGTSPGRVKMTPS